MTCAFKTVSVIGLGYIGLPTAAIFASRGVKVIGVDVNQHVVNTINKGEIHIIEPELDSIVSTVVHQGYLRATTKPAPADAFLIAVPTPFMQNHKPDTRFVEDAVRSIAPVLKKGDLVILESTSPIGTTEKLAEWLAKARPDLNFPQSKTKEADINIAYCPERVLPGKIVQELVKNNRIIGGITDVCSTRAIELYKIFVEAECIKTDARTAEMCKLTENSFRDVNIAFANELSIICEKLQIDVWQLIKLANLHPRVSILQPGPGVGGHCIAVDPWFIVSAAPDHARLIHVARLVNDSKPRWVLEKFKATVEKILNGDSLSCESSISVAFFGITFKPDIDDLRESPSLSIVEQVSQIHSGKLFIVEPHLAKLPENISKNIQLVDVDEALAVAKIVIFLVPHRQFKVIKERDLKMHEIIDTCGLMQEISE
jgi:UDP-N-acetyl-D-mannosaminuronic acid dehydrogenase